MSEALGARASEQEIRSYCHRVVESISQLKDNRLQAAERALQQAPNDAVRQTLVETSLSASDAVTAAFVQAAVRTGSVQLARAAADLLLDIKEADSALAVIAECIRSPDVSVCRRAVEAIEILRGPAALDLLTEAISSQDESVRLAAINTFGLVMGSKYHPLKEPLLRRLEDPQSAIHRIIVESQEVSLRREFAQTFGFADAERVLPLLRALSRDPDDQTRREVAIALAAQRSNAAIEVLRDMLEDADDVVVATVLDVLATRLGRDSPRMLSFVRQALRHPLAEVRRHAVLMLDRFRPADVREVLLEAARDEDFEVQSSAQSLLRRQAPGAAVPEPGTAGQYAPEEETLMVWEAASVGVATGGGQAAAIESLEQAALRGSPSVRLHALDELQQLRDIADSPGLQRGLYDADEAVRSRMAAGLSYTRDAGLLVQVLASHPDVLLRRQAAEALAQNPSGPPGGRPTYQGLTFTSARTVGVELFSRFLAALDDPDEGVRELACAAIGRYVEFGATMPVPTVLARLRALSEDDSASSLLRDTAHEVAAKLADAPLAGPLLGAANAVVEWRGRLAREAHAIRIEPRSGRFVLDAQAIPDVQELAQRWQAELGLTSAQSEAASAAMRSGEPMPDEVAQAAMGDLVRSLASSANAIWHTARAAGLIGDGRWLLHLSRWRLAMSADPAIEWGESEMSRSWRKLLPRLSARASIAALVAEQALKGKTEPAALDGVCAHQDEWVRMVALAERAALEENPITSLEALAALCRSHASDADYLEPVGTAAVALVAAGGEEFLSVAQSALEQAQTDLRAELTQRLMLAAQKEPVAQFLSSFLSRGPVAHTGRLCLALALRGAGGDLQGLDVPDAMPKGAEVELACAHRALGAMLGRSEAAEALKASLRGRQERERYCAAVYLGLARVQSATPIFASVSDQDAPWALRSLCAGMLVRRGHGLGMGWFSKNLPHATGPQKARMCADLGRAVQDVVALMLECKDVNLGRFV